MPNLILPTDSTIPINQCLFYNLQVFKTQTFKRYKFRWNKKNVSVQANAFNIMAIIFAKSFIGIEVNYWPSSIINRSGRLRNIGFTKVGSVNWNLLLATSPCRCLLEYNFTHCYIFVAFTKSRFLQRLKHGAIINLCAYVVPNDIKN